jgi:predicted metallopeptidase
MIGPVAVKLEPVYSTPLISYDTDQFRQASEILLIAEENIHVPCRLIPAFPV